MTKPASIQKELEQLGLSAKQAELYLLLVTQNELRIQEIAQRLHMPRSSVYESLKHLDELGLIEEIVDDNFKRIRAYPLSVLRHALQEQAVAVQKQLDRLQQLERTVQLAAPYDPKPTNLHAYKGRSGARQILWNTLKAQETIYVYSEWGRQQYVGLTFYENFAREAHACGVGEQVLINLTPETLENIRQYNVPRSPIARTSIDDIRVVDRTIITITGDTLMYNDIYAQVYLKNVELHGFEIENKHFVETQRSIFETLWRQATPVNEFLIS